MKLLSIVLVLFLYSCCYWQLILGDDPEHNDPNQQQLSAATVGSDGVTTSTQLSAEEDRESSTNDSESSSDSSSVESLQNVLPPGKRLVYCSSDKGYQYRLDGFLGFESKIAHELIRDEWCGIEIGPSACNPFGLNTIHVGLTEELDPIDYNHYKQGQINTCGDYAKIDVPGDALDLHLFSDYSVDFVVNSHVWEHVPNPLKALEEWMRVVRNNGIIYVIVPSRCASPIDCARNVTTIEELIHFYEINATLEDFKGVSEKHRGHLFVFTPDLLMEITLWFNKRHAALNDGQSLVLAAFKYHDDKYVKSHGHLIAWVAVKPEW